MNCFEYRSIEHSDSSRALGDLNEAEREGWEYVTALPGINGNASLIGRTFLVRRPVVEKPKVPVKAAQVARGKA